MTNEKRTFEDFCVKADTLFQLGAYQRNLDGSFANPEQIKSNFLALIREYKPEIDEAIEEEAREEGRREIWAILRKDAEKKDAQGGLERGAAPSKEAHD